MQTRLVVMRTLLNLLRKQAILRTSMVRKRPTFASADEDGQHALQVEGTTAV